MLLHVIQKLRPQWDGKLFKVYNFCSLDIARFCNFFATWSRWQRVSSSSWPLDGADTSGQRKPEVLLKMFRGIQRYYIVTVYFCECSIVGIIRCLPSPPVSVKEWIWGRESSHPPYQLLAWGLSAPGPDVRLASFRYLTTIFSLLSSSVFYVHILCESKNKKFQRRSLITEHLYKQYDR